jgi:hypothetical protein
MLIATCMKTDTLAPGAEQVPNQASVHLYLNQKSQVVPFEYHILTSRKLFTCSHSRLDLMQWIIKLASDTDFYHWITSTTISHIL